MAINVLYLHPFSSFGGATKSLSELVSFFPKSEVSCSAIVPKGPVEEALKQSGITTIRTHGLSQWDNTRYGHYRGLRWILLIREFYYLPATLRSVYLAVKKDHYDIIHCNEITVFLAGIFAKRLCKAALVVHVRSLQSSMVSGFLRRRFIDLLRKYADAVIAIDDAVRRTLPEDLNVRIIHNGLCASSISPNVDISQGKKEFLLISVGVLHRSKGLYELVEAIRILHARSIDVKLKIVGQNAHNFKGIVGWALHQMGFAEDVSGDLKRLTNYFGLNKKIEFVGFVADVSSLYKQADVLCFTSHLNAPGRPVFEAALHGVPSIVAMQDPTNDVVVSGKTGICIDQPTPEAIADAISLLVNNRTYCREMGWNAREHALKSFDSSLGARKMLEVYKKVISVSKK